MTRRLEAMYEHLKKSHEKLVLEEKELQKEHEQNVKYFINNEISDPEWQGCLVKTKSNLDEASRIMKSAEKKMMEIRFILYKKSQENDLS